MKINFKMLSKCEIKNIDEKRIRVLGNTQYRKFLPSLVMSGALELPMDNMVSGFTLYSEDFHEQCRPTILTGKE